MNILQRMMHWLTRPLTPEEQHVCGWALGAFAIGCMIWLVFTIVRCELWVRKMNRELKESAERHNREMEEKGLPWRWKIS